MRFSTKIIYLLFLLGILATGCEKDTQTNPTMSAIIDGVAWHSIEFESVLLDVESQNSIRLDIIGTSSDSKRIKLSIECPDNDGILKETTYDINDTINGAKLQYCVIDQFGIELIDHTTEEGSITIDEYDVIDKTVSGTYSFKSRVNGTNTFLQVKNGEFDNIEYTLIKY